MVFHKNTVHLIYNKAFKKRYSMNQSVNLESMNARPISKQDAVKIVAELSTQQYDKSFNHLHIATKYIKQNIDANNFKFID